MPTIAYGILIVSWQKRGDFARLNDTWSQLRSTAVYSDAGKTHYGLTQPMLHSTVVWVLAQRDAGVVP